MHIHIAMTDKPQVAVKYLMDLFQLSNYFTI